MEYGLFIGRFQPFHNGHLDAIRQCLLHEEKIIIAIGSSQEHGTEQNPYSAAQRHQMINAALETLPEFTNKYRIVDVPDINDNERWPAYVESLVPPFRAVYTGSDLTAALFKQYSAHPVFPLKKNIAVSATEVRSKIARGADWESSVPPSVALLLKKWR